MSEDLKDNEEINNQEDVQAEEQFAEQISGEDTQLEEVAFSEVDEGQTQEATLQIVETPVEEHEETSHEITAESDAVNEDEFLTEEEKYKKDGVISSTGIIDATKFKKKAKELSYKDYPQATLVPRAAAFIVDCLFYSFACTPFMLIFVQLGQIIGGVGSAMETMMSAAGLLAYVGVYVFFSALFNKNKGGGPGKLLFGLKVVDEERFEFLDFKTSFKREFLGKIISSILLIGYLMMLVRKDKKTLHDIIAKSRVIATK